MVVVSFWDYTSYSIVPDFIFTNYEDIFYGCIDNLPELCTAFSTYLSTIKFVIITWFITLIVGFLIALFLGFLRSINCLTNCTIFTLYNSFLDIKRY